MPQRLDINRNGVNGWYCSVHNVYNDILRVKCCYCNELRDESLDVVAAKVRIRREGWNMSEHERELHAKFYVEWQDDERLLVTDMSDEALTAHRNELARIALEGKVRATIADEEIRQRRAKKGQKNKSWLVPSESIDAEKTAKEVKSRGERMTRLDRINATLNNIMSEEDAQELMNGKIKNATDLKLGAFKIVKSEVKPTKPNDDEIFDFSKLEKL